MRASPGGRRVAAVLAASVAMALVAGCGGTKKPAISLPTSTSALTTTSTTASTTTHDGQGAPRTRLPAHRPGTARRACTPAGRSGGQGREPGPSPAPVGPRHGRHRFRGAGRRAGSPGSSPSSSASTGRIEPVRSGRLVDLAILQPLGHVLFAYSGAIQPVVNAIDSGTSLLEDVGANRAPGAYQRDPTRIEPHNLFTSTAALWSAAAALGYPSQAPAPIFKYGRLPAGGTAVSAVNVYFPLDVTTWTWKAKRGAGCATTRTPPASWRPRARWGPARPSRVTTSSSPRPTWWSCGWSSTPPRT